ncbi:hypothetical protein V6N13_122106 [Hibiscus sabdariffa]
MERLQQKQQEFQKPRKEQEIQRNLEVSKPSRGGKRFGFVRFGSEDEAMRAMERLNGYMIYGFMLMVKLAIQKVRRTGGPHKQQIPYLGLNAHMVGTNWKFRDEEALDGSARKKKISGHVKDEDLWKMKRMSNRGDGNCL